MHAISMETADSALLSRRSVFAGVVGGTAGTFSKITGALGKGLASLTFDDDHFVYWAGPIVGAVLAASVYHIMYFRSVVPFPKTFDHL